MAIRPKIVKLIDKYSQKRGLWPVRRAQLRLIFESSGFGHHERDLRQGPVYLRPDDGGVDCPSLTR